MKERILKIITDYCLLRRELKKYPYVISMVGLFVELKNANISIEIGQISINELIDEGKVKKYLAINFECFYVDLTNI
jgi:hypothetical protein